MNTGETVLTITEAGAFAFAALAIMREAVKRPWVRFSVSWSFAILPADKRDPAPRKGRPETPAVAAGANPAVTAGQDPAQTIRTAAA